MRTAATSILTPLSDRIGYARVSSVGQNLESHTDALQQAGCGKILSEKMTGSRMDRSARDRALEYVPPGDAIVVTELGRMARSLPDLFDMRERIEEENHI